MGAKKSNDKKGEEAVERLRELIQSGANEDILRHCQMKAAEINLFNGQTEHLEVKQVIRASRSAKTDLFVVFEHLSKPLGVSVISAGSGSSNHVERRNVEFYRKDLGLEDDALRLLQLFTGSRKPNEATSNEVTREPSAGEEYTRYSDLTQTAQKTLIDQIKLVRNELATNALLGRGNAVKCKDGKLRADEVSLIAFLDQKKPELTKWTFCDARQVVDSITADEVAASRDEGNQINLGRAMILKRYGGGSKKGDTSQKDQLQIQIYPRILYKRSTDFGHYKRVSAQLGLQRLEPESEDTDAVLLTSKAKAAKRGLEAEDALADEISQHNPDCRWIVEESTGSKDYSTYKAESPSNNKKADVVIFPILKPGAIEASLSIKTYRPDVSFGQVNRGEIEMYAEVFKMPNDILTIFKKYLKKGPNGERMKFNRIPGISGEEAGKVFLFLKSKQQEILQYIFCGAPNSDQKADWILLHSYTDENWRSRIGQKDNWRLYRLSDVIYACQAVHPQSSPKGDIILAGGVTAQRKGADKTDKNADDLQFKLSPKAIIELMEKTRDHWSKKPSLPPGV
jgi:hypothetical protein